MRRIAFSIAISGLMFLAVCGITQATPIAPVPPGVASNAANITPVYYYYHHHHYWHHHYWHYGYDPTAYNWDYYRVDSPGRGTDVESTR
jgi:hypothetical protein